MKNKKNDKEIRLYAQNVYVL